MKNNNQDIAKWRADPIAFIEGVLRDPETAAPFSLYEEQRQFLREGLARTPEGKMRYTELLFSGPKKSGKTTLASMDFIYTAVALAPIGGEVYCLANDLEQSTSRVFAGACRIIQCSPLLRHAATITANKIIFKSTGVCISALANDYRGFSGANPTLNCYDESAYYTLENSIRLFDEGIPSPARKISFRLSVSTAGFENESSPLRDLYDRSMEHGVEIAPDLRTHANLLCYWTNQCVAPWQSAQWVEEMRRTLRPPQFARLIENKWVASESTFVELSDWDSCVDPEMQPVIGDKSMAVWAGLDLGLKHDATALVAVAWVDNKLRLVDHRVFVPREGQTLNVEATAESAILDLRRRFYVRAVLFDPWQGISLAQRLTKLGVNMQEYTQTTGNLSVMAGTLLDLIRTRRLATYPSPELRLAIAKTVALESSRGWRLAKSKASDRIDPIVALAMASVGAVERRGGADKMQVFDMFTGRPAGQEADLPSWDLGNYGGRLN